MTLDDIKGVQASLVQKQWCQEHLAPELIADEGLQNIANRFQIVIIGVT